MSERLSNSTPSEQPLLDGRPEGDVMDEATRMDAERIWDERIRANSEKEWAERIRQNKIDESMSHQDEVRAERAKIAEQVDSKHEGNPQHNGSFNDMVKRSDETLKDSARKKRIEDRRNGKDRSDSGLKNVPKLNDQAQLEVWGADGRLWLGEDGKVLVDKDGYSVIRDEDGNERRGPKFRGRIEAIRDDRSRGKQKESDRDLAAGDYETELLGLVEEGLELCQAKLVMDLREEDDEAKPFLIESFILDGMSAVDAEARANAIYAKKDAARLKMIEDNGVFTDEEYKRVRRGEDLYPEHPPVDSPEPREPTPEPEPTPELPPPAEVARMVFNADDCQELGNALTEYAQLLAKFETQHTKRGRDVLETARRKFETQRSKMMGQLQLELEAAGYDPDAIRDELDRQNANINPQNRKVGGDLGLVEDATRIEAERFSKESSVAGKLTKIWRAKGWRGVLGKAGIMLPVGLAAGAAGGILVGPAVGAAAATFFATRLAKGFMGAKLSARAKATTNARINAEQRRNSQLHVMRQTGANVPEGMIMVPDVTSQFSAGGEDNIRNNQKRAGVLVGAGLAAGAVGAVAADHLDLNPFDGGDDKLPVPPVAEGDGDHFERTRFHELFKLDGDPDDPGRLQLVHEDQLDKASDLVTLRTADGNIIAEHMRIGPYGLRPEDLARIHEAGYEVNFTPDADSGAGRIEIFKTDLQEQE